MMSSKYKDIKIGILCVAAFVLILAGCEKQTPARRETDRTEGTGKPLVVELGVGVGPVKFGMSKEDVIEHLGQPDQIVGEGIALNYLSSRGLGFQFHPTRGVRGIDCWSKEATLPGVVVTDFVGATKEGIAMGASRQEIEAAYKQPDRVTTRGPLTTLHYEKLRAFFTFKGGRLVRLSMRAPM